jgi:hypothetical protein
MCLADFAWHEVDTTIIRNCLHKAKILPNMDLFKPNGYQQPP